MKMISEEFRLRKRDNPELYDQYKRGAIYASVTVGETYLFAKQGLKLYAVPMERIARMWRRVEEVASRVGCCSNDFSVHRLMILLKDEREVNIKIGEGLYRHEPELLMEALRTKCPEVRIGKPEA